ncbi:hypothetical protein [Lederbergia graminis]|uniref:Uncharacterized protein n=1 Tax=Lederbergia graminis TaxID=735518 RepID=A0ABW0LKY6_9BACI
MDKLKKQLRSTLLENPAIEMKESSIWYLPVTTYDVAFTRVKRSKMDILMKMMLLTFEQTTIRRAANLSELLLVEELFIEDLLIKMQRMGLIRLEREVYQLTLKGEAQIQTGIMEEELDVESTHLFYSPVHDQFWAELSEPSQVEKEELEPFRYKIELNEVNTDRLLEVLAETENRLDEDGFQTVVADVNSYDQQEVAQIPCIEFQLYNKEKDIFFARVWNTGLKRWDDILEQQIDEKDRLEWREKWAENS